MTCIKHETMRNPTLKQILVSSASSSPSVEFHLAARACQGAGSALAARGTQRWKQPMVPLVARRGTIVNNEVCPMFPRFDTEHTELCLLHILWPAVYAGLLTDTVFEHAILPRGAQTISNLQHVKATPCSAGPKMASCNRIFDSEYSSNSIEVVSSPVKIVI